MQLKTDVDIYVLKARSSLSKLLKQVRSGEEGTETLDNYLSDLYNNEVSPQNFTLALNGLSEIQEKVDFARSVVHHGATYIGSGGSLNQEIINYYQDKMYVLFFIPGASYIDSQRWNENNQIFFHDLKQGHGSGQRFYVVDGSFQHIPSNLSSVVKILQKGVPVIDDLLADYKAFSGKPLIQWAQEPTRVVNRPTNLVDFSSTCAGKTCNATRIYSWICKTCGKQVQLDAIGGDFLYCDCGKSFVNSSTFKCSDPKHGLEYNMHEESYLRDVIDNLRPPTTPYVAPTTTTTTTAKPPPKVSQVRWEAVRNNKIPFGSLLGGYESSTIRLYISKAMYSDGDIIGKAIVDLDNSCSTCIRRAYFGWGSWENTIQSYYEMLVAPESAVRWVIATKGYVPAGAVRAGKQPGNNEPYYVCRLAKDHRLIPGRVYRPGKRCYSTLDGREVSLDTYEVLVDLSKI